MPPPGDYFVQRRFDFFQPACSAQPRSHLYLYSALSLPLVPPCLGVPRINSGSFCPLAFVQQDLLLFVVAVRGQGVDGKLGDEGGGDEEGAAAAAAAAAKAAAAEAAAAANAKERGQGHNQAFRRSGLAG